MVWFTEDIYDEEQISLHKSNYRYNLEDPLDEPLKQFRPDYNVYTLRRVHELDVIEETLQNATQCRRPESYLILDPDGHICGPDCRKTDCKHNADVHHADLKKWDQEDFRTLLLNWDPEIAVDLQQVDIMDPMSEGWSSFLIKFKICGGKLDMSASDQTERCSRNQVVQARKFCALDNGGVLQEHAQNVSSGSPIFDNGAARRSSPKKNLVTNSDSRTTTTPISRCLSEPNLGESTNPDPGYHSSGPQTPLAQLEGKDRESRRQNIDSTSERTFPFQKVSCSLRNCRDQFKRSADWKRHARTHDSPLYSCGLCLDEKFECQRSYLFMKHLETHHKGEWSKKDITNFASAQNDTLSKRNYPIQANVGNENTHNPGNAYDSRSRLPVEWSSKPSFDTQQQQYTVENDDPDIISVSGDEESNSVLFGDQRAISQQSPSRVQISQYLSDDSTSMYDALSPYRSSDEWSEDWSEAESWSTLENSGDLRPFLDHYRREILESCMVVFWSTISRLWRSLRFQRTVAQSPTSLPSHSTSRSQAPPTQPSIVLQGAQKATWRRQGRDFDEDEEENPPKRRKNTEMEPQDAVEKLKYACPYRKHNRRQYNMHTHRTCALTSFISTHRIKEHLYRTHRAKVHCPRCTIELEDKQALDTHLLAEPICRINEGTPIEGFDLEIERRLRSRKKDFPNQTEAQKWAAIYALLFPGKGIPSPYFEPPEDDPVPPQTSMEDYMRQDVPRRARIQLENQFAMTQNPNLTRDQAIADMVDMIVTIIDSSLSAYRSTLSEKKDVAQMITPPREPPSQMLGISRVDSGPSTQIDSVASTTTDSRTDMLTSTLQSQVQSANDMTMTTPNQVNCQAVAASPNVILEEDLGRTSLEPIFNVPSVETTSSLGVKAGFPVYRESSEQVFNIAITSEHDINPLRTQEGISPPPDSNARMISSNENESFELFRQPEQNLSNCDTPSGLELLDEFLDFDMNLDVDWNFLFMNPEVPLEGNLPDQT